MVIPIIIRGASMAAGGAKKTGGKIGQFAQQGFQGAQNIGQNVGGAIQRGWQNVPGSAKVGTGVGLMASLAVGAAGKAQQAVFGRVPKQYGGLIILFPIILAITDFFVGLNGIPLTSVWKNPNILTEAVTRIVVDSPYWVFLLIYYVLRKPKAKEDFIFPAVMLLIGILTLIFGGFNFWIFYHLVFAFITFVVFLRGFDSKVPIDGRHWAFMLIFVIDIFGLATFKALYNAGIFAFALPELLLNRIIFPIWLFYYLALVRDSAFKTGFTIFLFVSYGGYIGFGYLGGLPQIELSDLTQEQDDAKKFISRSVNNLRDAIAQWVTQRVEYAVTGKVEENQFEPLGVSLENVQSADESYFEDEDIIIWGTVKARTLDDPINIKVGCFVEEDDNRLDADMVDPSKKFSVFTSEEEDFACTFNSEHITDDGPLKSGSNTITAFADFNFETLAYLKVYFIDRDRQRAMTREGLDIFEAFDIQDRNPVAVYTNGPAQIEMGTNTLVAVSDSYTVEPSFDVKIRNREEWQGKIVELKEFVVFLPEGAIPEGAILSCNKPSEEYTLTDCRDTSCVNFVRNECLEVCDGFIENISKPYNSCMDNCNLEPIPSIQEECIDGCGRLRCTTCENEPLGEDCIDCKRGLGINSYSSCANECEDNFDECKDICDSFFQEGTQKYKGYALVPKEDSKDKEIEEISFRCRLRPSTDILDAPLTTKSIRVKARYDYSLEETVSVDIEGLDEDEGVIYVGPPLELRVKDDNNAIFDGITSTGPIVLSNRITIVWDLSVNDGSGSNNVVKYRIYRKEEGGNWVKLGEDVPNGITEFPDDSSVVSDAIASGTFTFYYYVEAIDNENNWEKSAEMLKITQAGVERPEIDIAPEQRLGRI